MLLIYDERTNSASRNSVHDGWGIAPKPGLDGNAIEAADTTNMDTIAKTHSYRTLAASGTAVGLNEGLMGNSEVGYVNHGCPDRPGGISSTLFLGISTSALDGSFGKISFVSTWRSKRNNSTKTLSSSRPASGQRRALVVFISWVWSVRQLGSPVSFR